MPTARLTSKGQITVPRDVRRALGLRTGDRVSFRIRRDGTVVVEPETIDVMSLAGAVEPRVRGVSIEDMKKAIARGAARGKRRR